MESVLIHLIILVLVFGCLFWALTLVPIPQPYGRIAQVLLGVLLIVIILTRLLPYAGIR